MEWRAGRVRKELRRRREVEVGVRGGAREQGASTSTGCWRGGGGRACRVNEAEGAGVEVEGKRDVGVGEVASRKQCQRRRVC